MGYGLYLYGIFPAPGPQDLQLNGLDNQPVQFYQIDHFIFLYSEAKQERYLASRKNLLGHERVLEQAMEQGYRTLLPVPFNRFIFQSWDAIAQEFIVPYAEQMQQLFHQLEGLREVSVKVMWDETAEQQLMMEENPDLAMERDRLEGKNLSMDEVIRFGQATERAMERHQEAIVEAFRAQLNPLATRVEENDPQQTTMIYNTAFLIPWDAEAEFGHQVEALDHQFNNRLRIRYNNFTAPYNFARLNGAE